MKNRNLKAPFLGLGLFIFVVCFGFSACKPKEENVEIKEVSSLKPDSIVGEYIGKGECVQADTTGNLGTGTFTEHDKISIYPGTGEGIYEVRITADPFYETEIGVLSGNVLRTATWDVIDNNYPVLEEYVFDFDEKGNATGYIKTVRNPTKENFKVCVVYGEKK